MTMKQMSKTTIHLVAAAFAVALTGACGGAGETAPDNKPAEKKPVKKAEKPKPADKPVEKAHVPDPQVVKAAGIAKEIEAAPETADEILKKHGLDRDKFEAMILEIAKNAVMSTDYEELLLKS
jgi:hypothetical protein